MARLTECTLIIEIPDGSPAERREMLIKAIASALRWYALHPDKRKEDGQHAACLSDLIHELIHAA